MKKTTSLFILMVFATVSMTCDEQAGEPTAPRGSATAPAAATPGAGVDTVALATRATGAKFGAFIEKIPGGRIDWSRGVVYAMGIGKPRRDHVGAQATAMAKRAAYIVAARNATLVLAGIAPGPGGRFANVRNGWIRTDVTLKDFRVTSATYNRSTRTATASLEMPLYGATGAIRALGMKLQLPTRFRPGPYRTDIRRSGGVILIDARGTGLSPSLAPWIVDTQGRAGLYASSRGQIDRGMARYVTLGPDVKLLSPTRKIKTPRDSTVVRIFRASKVRPGEPYSIVLTKENMAKLLLNGRNYPIGRIVIILDETGK